MMSDLETLCDAIGLGKVRTLSNKATWDYLGRDLKAHRSSK